MPADGPGSVSVNRFCCLLLSAHTNNADPLKSTNWQSVRKFILYLTFTTMHVSLGKAFMVQ